MRREVVRTMNAISTPDIHIRIGPASSCGGSLFIMGIVTVE